MPLQILDIGDLEMLMPYTRSGQCSFSECLMERARKGDKALAFREFFSDYYRERGMRPEPNADFQERSHAVFDRITMRFFGKHYSDS